MKKFSILSLALVWLAFMATTPSPWSQAAGLTGCCTRYSKLDAAAAAAMLRPGRSSRCRRQGITEGCSIRAMVIKWKRHKVCVNPTPRRMQRLLAALCSKNGRRKERKPDRPPRRKTA